MSPAGEFGLLGAMGIGAQLSSENGRVKGERGNAVERGDG